MRQAGLSCVVLRSYTFYNGGRLNDITAHDCKYHGVHASEHSTYRTRKDVVMERLHIRRCGAGYWGALLLYLGHDSPVTYLRLRHVDIAQTRSALYVRFSAVKLQDSTFLDTGFTSGYTVRLGALLSVNPRDITHEVVNNRFVNCSLALAYDDYSYGSYQRLVVAGNKFVNASHTRSDGPACALHLDLYYIRGSQQHPRDTLQVYDNVFADNHCPNTRLAFVQAYYVSGEPGFRFHNNTCTRNVATAMLHWNVDSHRLIEPKEIIGNIWTDNQASNAVLLLSDPASQSKADTTRPMVQSNIFDNPASDLEVRSDLDDRDLPVLGRYNYFGTTESLAVTDRIFDGLDDNAKEFFDFFPYLLSSDTANPQTVDALSIVQADGSLAGAMTTSHNLTAGVYHVNSSIFVLPGSTLWIDAGVTLLMSAKAQASIVVLGTLVLLGTAALPVEIRPFDEMVSLPERGMYLGCYLDSGFRDLSGLSYRDTSSLTIEQCVEYCHSRLYAFAGLQNYYDCRCGQTYGTFGRTDEVNCNRPCRGNSTQICGGSGRNSIYATGWRGARWGRIAFRASAQPTVFDSDLQYRSGSVVSHATMEHAGTQSGLSVLSLGVPVLVEYVNITGAQGTAVEVNHVRPPQRAQVLRELTLVGGMQSGIVLQGISCDATCTLHDIVVSNFQNYGLYSSVTTARTELRVSRLRAQHNGFYLLTPVNPTSSTAEAAGVRLTCGNSNLPNMVLDVDHATLTDNFGPGLHSNYCPLRLYHSTLARNSDHNSENSVFFRNNAYRQLVVQHNTFSENRFGINFAYSLASDVSHNVFERNTNDHGDVLYFAAQYGSSTQLEFAYNRLANNTNNGATGFSIVQLYIYYVYPNTRIAVHRNEFINNYGGHSVIEWASTPYQAPCVESDVWCPKFVYNELIGNNVSLPSGAVLLTQGYRGIFGDNLMSNEAAPAEMTTSIRCTSPCSTYCVSQCPYNLSAPRGFWGSDSPAQIENRIYHSIDDPALPFIDTGLFRLNLTGDCSPPDCSGHGACVFPDQCRCEVEWQGPACDQFSCPDTFQCNAEKNGGNCTGPNVCTCNPGWKPPGCRVPVCSPACESGNCIAPDTCRCFTGFAGAVCDRCDGQHAGQACEILCPACVAGQGTCDSGRTGSGKCVCLPNFSGNRCQSCAEGFFGSRCEALPAYSGIVPNSGQDVGNQVVSILGYNFDANQTYQCRFHTTMVPGTVVSSRRVDCRSPPSPSTNSDEFRVAVQLFENSQRVVYYNGSSTLYFTYLGVCPESLCLYGACVQRSCVCYRGWTGASCNITIIPPTIGALSPMVGYEQEPMRSPLFAVTGTAPITWSIVGSQPSGLTIVASSGEVRWLRPVALFDRPYALTLEARNEIGYNRAQLSIYVMPSYNVTASLLAINLESNTVDQSADFVTAPVAAALLLRGQVRLLHDRISPAGQTVRVWLRRPTTNQVIERTATTITDGTFQTLVYLNVYHAGQYIVGAGHPQDPDRTLRQGPGIIVNNMQTQNLPLASGYPRRFQLQGQVDNLGDHTISNMRVTLPSGVTLPAGIVDLTMSIPATVEPRSSVKFNVSFAVLGNMNYWVDLVISSPDVSRSVFARLTISVQEPQPRLIAQPGSLQRDVVRGAQFIVEFNVTNTGGAETGDLVVLLPPNMDFLSLVTDSSQLRSLKPGNTTQIAIMVSPAPTASLGTISGTLYVNSPKVGRSVSFRFGVVSNATGTLRVFCRDEASFHSPENPKPLITGAIVTATSSDGRIKVRDTTQNASGLVVFEDIPEAFYNVHVQALNHSSYSETIHVPPQGATVNAFLAYSAVSYTWTVRPVRIREKITFKYVVVGWLP